MISNEPTLDRVLYNMYMHQDWLGDTNMRVAIMSAVNLYLFDPEGHPTSSYEQMPIKVRCKEVRDRIISYIQQDGDSDPEKTAYDKITKIVEQYRKGEIQTTLSDGELKIFYDTWMDVLEKK